MVSFNATPTGVAIYYDIASIDRWKAEEKKKSEQLQEALASGDDMRAVSLLQKRAKGPVPPEKFERLFSKALETHNTTACLKLINRGYDPKIERDKYLGWALEMGLAKSVLKLIEYGATKELSEEEKVEYLRKAIERSQSKAAFILIAQIENIDVQDEDDGYSFLHLACKLEMVDIAQALLAKGIATSLTDHKGRTALDIAKKRNNAALIALL